MRYLVDVHTDEVVAYAPNRRDFYRASDDMLWAHESHSWLVDATSGSSLAHRTGNVYFDAITGSPLYYETWELPAKAEGATSPTTVLTARSIRRPR